VNAVTKTNWEGTASNPTSSPPADQALDVAHLAALDRVNATIDPKNRPDMAKELDDAIARTQAGKEVEQSSSGNLCSGDHATR
jgi:hypothetical protein